MPRLPLPPPSSVPIRARPGRALCGALLALLGACGEGEGARRRYDVVATPPLPGVQEPDPALREPQPPWLRLPPGARYFERDGIQAPVLLRNVSAPSVEAFTPLFRDARDAGTTVVRLQLTQGFGYDTLGMSPGGGVLASWARAWDAVLDDAERQGLAVIVVFTLWGDWNDGTPALGWSHFDAHPLGSARGGPAAAPGELFADTETRRLWLDWLAALVRRWSSRPNVIAWEVFSEIDLATGVTEQSATRFTEEAQRVIREIEPWRPAYVSTSDLPLLEQRPWQGLWDSPGNQIASIHPYAAELDRAAADRARNVWLATGKPVLVGESGLDAAAPDGTTLTSTPRAAAGLRHAIWAELASGAASARALYWEDGYAVYFPAAGLPLVAQHRELEREAARWLAGKDFRDREPVQVQGEPALFGTALAGPTRVSGWARNEQLSAPEWSAAPLDRAEVQVPVPAESANARWDITLTNPEDGSVTEVAGSSNRGVLFFEVAGPFESVAFDARRGDETGPVCPGTDGTCAGPVYALELNGVSLFADPACPAPIFLHFIQCRAARFFTLSSCPSADVADPRSCVSLRAYIDGTPSGSGDYYDAQGARHDVVIDGLELGLDGLDRETLRSGVLRGSMTRSGGDGSSQPFELSFRACSQALAVCLI